MLFDAVVIRPLTAEVPTSVDTYNSVKAKWKGAADSWGIGEARTLEGRASLRPGT